MTLSEPIPKLLVARVSVQQGPRGYVFRNGEAHEVEFSNPPRADLVPS
jgi:hypothetical protein